jgi:hypothetical protein
MDVKTSAVIEIKKSSSKREQKDTLRLMHCLWFCIFHSPWLFVAVESKTKHVTLYCGESETVSSLLLNIHVIENSSDWKLY